MEPTALESTAESCLHMPGRNSKTGEDDEEAKRSCLDEGKLRSQIGEGGSMHRQQTMHQTSLLNLEDVCSDSNE